jgi:cytochrome c oxidase assembly protein subunit 15
VDASQSAAYVSAARPDQPRSSLDGNMTTATDHFATPSLDAASARGIGAVRVWLWSVAGLVFLMVVVGGATRLTESGLSITEWKPITGVLPPLGEAAWLAEFEKYKQIPQYSKLFPSMTLGEFQSIFFWEWGHRLLGRLIGVAFALPLAWFWVRGQLPASLKPKLVGLLLLGGLQGAVGWWMVASGLVDRVEVAPERLAIHLLLASLTFVGLVWLAVGLKPAQAEPAAASLRRGASWLLGLVLGQIGLGALVAGARAGLTYNTWPLMDGRFIPRWEHLSPMEPGWKNLFENITTVQFDHRMVAYALFAWAIWHAVAARRVASGTKAAKRATALAGLVTVQAGIGIMTLLLVVPIWAGLLHQAFAMMVLAMATVHRSRLS